MRPALAGERSTNEAALASEAEKDLVKEISFGGGVVQRWELCSVKNISCKI
jgi:hypothetical protein